MLADNIITLNSNFTTGTPSEDSGIEVLRGSSATKKFFWDESADRWFADDGLESNNLYLSGVTQPTIFFNGSSDSGIDMAIRATPEGLDFYEPEDGNKVHFQVLDDTGVNAVFGYKLNGTEIVDTSRNLVNIGTINTGQGATEVHLMNQNLRTSDNVAFNQVTAAFVGNVTGTSDRAEAVDSNDTRGTNDLPNSREKGVYFDFKSNATNGLSDGGSYNGQMTWRSYGGGSDLSGGYPIQI